MIIDEGFVTISEVKNLVIKMQFTDDEGYPSFEDTRTKPGVSIGTIVIPMGWIQSTHNDPDVMDAHITVLCSDISRIMKSHNIQSTDYEVPVDIKGIVMQILKLKGMA